MDDDDALDRARQHVEWREGIEATLSRADAALAEGERRRLEREERGERPWPTAEPLEPGMRTQGHENRPAVDPVHPMHRGAGVPRDWIAEAAWVRSLIDQRMKSTWTDAIGQALGQLGKELDRDVTALRADLDALRAEVRREAEVGDGVTRLERLVARMEVLDRDLRRLERREPALAVTH